MSSTPFLDAIQQLSRRDGRFFVPGHKGNAGALSFLGPAARYDVTEIEGADDLANPTGPLAESQRNMARLYQSGATLYSAAGATSCVQAMLAVFVPPGASVVVARGCHVSAVRALAVLDARPHWLWPGPDGQPSAAAAGQALAQSGAKALYVTSPDYYGHTANIAALAAECRRHKAALLVDNAHGAHLRFVSPDTHPLTLGADATADSAHKTLPCLTGAAMLHLKNGALAGEARQALNFFCSTSPSYLVLASLDSAAGLLADAPPDFNATAARLAECATPVADMRAEGGDPLRLCLVPKRTGWPAARLAGALAAAGLTPELYNGQRIVLMASPFNAEQDFETLAGVLRSFGKAGPDVPDGAAEAPLERPETVCTVRQALFGAKTRLPVAEAAGRVCASLAVPCPPGVPAVLPGERLDEAACALLAAGGISALDVLK